MYMETATDIATTELASLGRVIPTSDEARWLLYVKEGRRCQCGAVLTRKQRKWCSAVGHSQGRHGHE
jgi:hypothetical protein